MKYKKVNSLKLNDSDYPAVLRNIPSPPEQLFWLGHEPKSWLEKPKVAVVGSRKATPYGQVITERIAGELARAGVVIISGLAYGIDSIAHRSALKANGVTVAVLPGSVEQVYPASHAQLAEQIIYRGGSLISEYRDSAIAFKSNFIARNRIVSGLADVLLITEAALKSGSLHTARFALEQGKTVMAVPGSVLSPSSEGCNNLIKSGAVPATSAEDVFFALDFRPQPKNTVSLFKGSPKENEIIRLLANGLSDQEELAVAAGMDGAEISSLLTTLEIGGHIRAAGAGNWLLS